MLFEKLSKSPLVEGENLNVTKVKTQLQRECIKYLWSAATLRKAVCTSASETTSNADGKSRHRIS